RGKIIGLAEFFETFRRRIDGIAERRAERLAVPGDMENIPLADPANGRVPECFLGGGQDIAKLDAFITDAETGGAGANLGKDRHRAGAVEKVDQAGRRAARPHDAKAISAVPETAPGGRGV